MVRLAWPHRPVAKCSGFLWALTWQLIWLESVTFGVLLPGDLGFVGFNADGDSDFAIVALRELTNETIFFSDNEPAVGGTSFLNSSEGGLQWDTGTITIPAGSIITFNDVDSVTNSLFGASVGTLTMPDTGFNISASGDSIYAYQGTNVASPTVFIAAIANDDFGLSTTGVLSRTGLQETVDAIEFATNTADGGAYVGPREGEQVFSDYLSLINDPQNWSVEGSFGEDALPFSTQPFNVVAIPEPSAVGFLGVISIGIAATSLMSRNRFSTGGNE